MEGEWQRIEELDELLAECAARAVRTQTERLRIERAEQDAGTAVSGAADALARHRTRLEAEQRRLSELMDGLRDLRRRMGRAAAA